MTPEELEKFQEVIEAKMAEIFQPLHEALDRLEAAFTKFEEAVSELDGSE